jgi:hypothetical protein
VDTEWHQFLLLDEISDHTSDGTAIQFADGYVIAKNGNRHPKKMTRGWEFLTQMKEGFPLWVPLKELKESNPIELAEYAVANKIDHEPAFAWWVPFVRRKRNHIVSKLQKKYWGTSHKIGIEILHNVERAYAIDDEGNWQGNAKGQGCVWGKGRDTGAGSEWRSHRLHRFQEITRHLIFDLKMDFSRKFRMVANGAMTEAPASLTYSSVVSRDSVRLAFLIAELNDLDIMAYDVGNAYLNAPCREKIWFKAGAEHGDKKG